MFAISPTDINWYLQLKNEISSENELVNFWTPTPWNVRQLQKGDKFYFMLKSPIRKIGGLGIYQEYKNMLPLEAWQAFGRNNGVEDLSGLIDRTKKYITKNSSSSTYENNQIGCIILNNLIFFDENNYKTDTQLGVSFSQHIVKIKFFNQADPNINEVDNDFEDYLLITTQGKKRKFISQTDRKGQSHFRKLVLKNYNNQCAITQNKEVQVLEAAHIQSYISEKSNHIQNGICLRADIHKLFDNGLITIDQNFVVNVSSKIKDLKYKTFHGKGITLPLNQRYYPSIDALEFHNKNIFRDN